MNRNNVTVVGLFCVCISWLAGVLHGIHLLHIRDVQDKQWAQDWEQYWLKRPRCAEAVSERMGAEVEKLQSSDPDLRIWSGQ